MLRTVIVTLLLASTVLPLQAFRARPVSDLRFTAGKPNAQTSVVATAGDGLYLVAWIETSQVRVSRIDRLGRYLDGAGVVVGNGGGPLIIAGNGTSWLVVWQLAAARVSIEH